MSIQAAIVTPNAISKWTVPAAASFTAFTLSWIVVCLFNNGDAFPQGAAVLLLPLPFVTAVLAWRTLATRNSRGLKLTLVFLAVACVLFWALVPNGWWATPPPRAYPAR